MPRTGEWGKADASYAVITPAGNSTARTLEMWRGKGTVKFHRARWEDMPTQYMIVNAFADLDIVEFRGATMTKSDDTTRIQPKISNGIGSFETGERTIKAAPASSRRPCSVRF